jgi:hypothetical protein
MLATRDDYGFTYDEPPHIRYGERILQFYASGFTERRALATSYVGGFDLLAALVRRVSPFGALATNHIVCIFVAQCGLVGTWKLGRFLGGSFAGFCGVLFLLLIPIYYGHQFNNPKDVPFAAGYVWGLYYITRALSFYGLPHLSNSTNLSDTEVTPSWPFFLRLGLALGLGMSVRVGGVLLVAYLILFLALTLLDRKRLKLPVSISRLKPSIAPLVVAIGLSWTLMIALWPKALLSPVKGPAEAASQVTRFKTFDSPTLFRGKLISSHDVPWDYLPTYFLQQLPEFVILCLVGTLAWLTVSSYRALKQRRALPLCLWLLVVATFLPPAYAIVRHSVLYDGLRHFLFLMPPIAVLSGIGFSKLLQLLGRRRPVQAIAAIFALFVFDQAYAIVRLHPHQHVYFNRISGGPRAADKRFETEYYGSVYRDLHTQLQNYLWKHHKDAYLTTTISVAGCGSNLFFTENLPVNFRYRPAGKAAQADIFATYARDRCLERNKGYPELLRVSRDGATLGIARSIRKELSPKLAAKARRRDD